MKNQTATLTMLFTLVTIPASANIIDNIFYPETKPSPTYPEQPSSNLRRISNISSIFNKYHKGIPYQGGHLSPKKIPGGGMFIFTKKF